MTPKKDYDTLVAMFWAAFGAASKKPIDPECVEVAKEQELDFYNRVKGNEKTFQNDKYLKETLSCCRDAGEEAAKLSKSAATISGDVFRTAVASVKDKAKKEGARGGICF